MKNIFGIIALIAISSFAKADEDYFVKASIYDSKNLIGSPSLRVEPNKETGVVESGKYDLKITVQPVNENTAAVKTNLVVGGEAINPSILVEIGKESKVSVGSKSLTIVVNYINS